LVFGSFRSTKNGLEIVEFMILCMDGYVSPQKNTKAVDPSTGKRKQCGLR
jgi:hypothetical protein